MTPGKLRLLRAVSTDCTQPADASDPSTGDPRCLDQSDSGIVRFARRAPVAATPDAQARLVADMSGTARRGRRSTPEPGEFVNVARDAFRFLEPHLSPHVVCDIPKLAVVCYCSEDTAVEIIHDRLRGGELYVALTRRLREREGPAVERESLGDIIAVDYDLAGTGVRTFMVRPHDTALLRHCVGRLARWTWQYATPVLAGDAAWFRRRDQQRDPHAPGNRLERAQRAARTAWSDGDYRTAITSYETLSHNELLALPPLDQARLRYARKMTDDDRAT